MTVNVLDTSHWKNPVDWCAVKAAGFDFCIAKATEGETWTDSYYAASVAGMNAQDIIDGSYHYYRAISDPTKQARHYWEIACADGIHIPPVVDVERINNVNAYTKIPLVTPALFTTALRVFLDVTAELWGERPWIYTNAYSWHTLTTKPAWAKEYPLWVANYGVTAPYLPSGWVTYILWQYTAAYQIAGKNYDANKFPGEKDELLQLCGAPVPPTLEERVARLEKAVFG